VPYSGPSAFGDETPDFGKPAFDCGKTVIYCDESAHYCSSDFIMFAFTVRGAAARRQVQRELRQ
jgi:hypothetical protein